MGNQINLVSVSEYANVSRTLVECDIIEILPFNLLLFAGSVYMSNQQPQNRQCKERNSEESFVGFTTDWLSTTGPGVTVARV